MIVFQWLNRLDLVQRSRRFRVIASLVIVALAIGLYTALVVKAHAPGTEQEIAQRSLERQRSLQRTGFETQGIDEHVVRFYDSLLVGIRPLQGRSETDAPPPSAGIRGAVVVGVLFFSFAAIGVAVTWLGLLLTYLGFFALGWGIGVPLILLAPGLGVGQILVAATPLALIFFTGMELLRLVFSWPSPVFAVAQNVLSEAVRMKISLVFIVMIILLLSFVPGSLDADQPLRYRVQQWLQYGIGLSYVVLTLLTLFLSTASVAFEQRDKVIWQTMSKPVRPWQYLLGKWVGVMGLNLVLLTVISGGVFLFTEYLRRQPAQGEMAFHVREDGVVTLNRPGEMTEDRRILETQVLTARVGRFIEPMNLRVSGLLDLIVDQNLQRRIGEDQTLRDTPQLRREIREEALRVFNGALANAVDGRIADRMSRDSGLLRTPRLEYQVEQEVLAEWEGQHRSVPPGRSQQFVVVGLPHTPPGQPPRAMTLKYKINAGSNDPSQIYRIAFILGGEMIERQAALKSAQTLTFPSSLVAPNGVLEVGFASAPENEREISIPPDGIEVLYDAGGYTANFARVMFAIWIKLGFIASASIAAATFLSFPVACLVALSILFAAESAGFLRESLEYYSAVTPQGTDYFAFVIRAVAVPVEWFFRIYAQLKPTGSLVDGRLVGWGTILQSVAVVGAWTLAALGLGWAVFRQRELATYSGR